MDLLRMIALPFVIASFFAMTNGADNLAEVRFASFKPLSPNSTFGKLLGVYARVVNLPVADDIKSDSLNYSVQGLPAGYGILVVIANSPEQNGTLAVDAVQASHNLSRMQAIIATDLHPHKICTSSVVPAKTPIVLGFDDGFELMKGRGKFGFLTEGNATYAMSFRGISKANLGGKSLYLVTFPVVPGGLPASSEGLASLGLNTLELQDHSVPLPSLQIAGGFRNSATGIWTYLSPPVAIEALENNVFTVRKPVSGPCLGLEIHARYSAHEDKELTNKSLKDSYERIELRVENTNGLPILQSSLKLSDASSASVDDGISLYWPDAKIAEWRMIANTGYGTVFRAKKGESYFVRLIFIKRAEVRAHLPLRVAIALKT